MESNQSENRGKVVVMQTSINYIHSVNPDKLEDIFSGNEYDKKHVGEQETPESIYYVIEDKNKVNNK